MPAIQQPTSLPEVCQMMDSLDVPMIYGGGTAIQILLKQGVLFAQNLIDISRVPHLADIEETADGLRFGPMVSIRTAETDPRVRARAPLAAMTYGRVANARVRNTASVGGNLAHGDYRLDPPTALLALGASVEVTSVRGVRTIPVREFFVDFQLTAIEPGELITAIEVPDQPVAATCAYIKLSSLGENDWPAASAAALLDRDTGWLRIGIGALAAVPRYTDVDIADRTCEQAIAIALEACEPLLDPIADIRGSASYKRRLGMVAVEDAVQCAWERAER